MISRNLALKNLGIKFKESLSAVLPIIIIVFVLTMSVAPVSSGVLLSFIFGSVMLIAGMMFFTLGSEISMTKIGESVGARITKSRKIFLIVIISFVTGFIVTVAEPDLLVLADQLPTIPSWLLIILISVGVGLFLVVAFLRMLFGIPLQRLLLIIYAIIFVFSFFVPKEFIAVSFDSGGVTTGPMTVPFIMAFGVGIASIRSDKHAADDSFGLVALCSTGPILAVMILGMIFGTPEGEYIPPSVSDPALSSDMAGLFLDSIPKYMLEIVKSLLPILAFYLLFSFFFEKPEKGSFVKTLIGILYTYFGLVTFLTGVNVGFLPMGYLIGNSIAAANRIAAIPVAMVIGFFVVRAEPAVYVLNKQVEEITDGGISASTMGLSLSIGVAISLGLSIVRIVFSIPILYFLIPGYAIALIVSFFVPKMYTAIAFDSGGVASGPMTAAFILPFAQGICIAVGGNVVTDAFGIVAMVAMTPLITIQVLGLVSVLKNKNTSSDNASGNDSGAEDGIIEL